jgi:hypothetical protein
MLHPDATAEHGDRGRDAREIRASRPIVTRRGTATQALRWRAAIWLLVALLCLLQLFAERGRAEEAPRLESLVDAFVQIVARGEFGTTATGVARWANSSIDVAVLGTPTSTQRVAIDRHLDRMTRTMNVSLREVGPIAGPARDWSPADMPVDMATQPSMITLTHRLQHHDWRVLAMLGRDRDYYVWYAHMILIVTSQPTAIALGRYLNLQSELQRDIASGLTPCFAYMGLETARHLIRYAIIVLRSDVTEWMQRRCVHEELTQAMGLRNDIPDSSITLFDDNGERRRQELTRYDWVFLEVLYDPRLAPGLRGTALRDMARRLIAERLAGQRRD